MNAFMTAHRARLALAGGLLLAIGAGFGAAAMSSADSPVIAQTDAAWVTQEAGAIAATADTVSPPATTCHGRNGAPNLIDLAPADDGLAITGYLVTITVTTDAPRWETGEAEAGVPYIPANTPTYVPTTTSTVAWGIGGSAGASWEGDVTVRALGPGGWASEPVASAWTISYDWLGIGYGTCTAA